MARQPSDEVRLNESLDLIINELPATDDKVKWIRDMEKVVAENRYVGEQVQKDRIPRKYIRKYGINNLYRYHHPKGFRSTYTVITPTKGSLLCDNFGPTVTQRVR
jgi:restriction endonuclease S subunit